MAYRTVVRNSSSRSISAVATFSPLAMPRHSKSLSRVNPDPPVCKARAASSFPPRCPSPSCGRRITACRSLRRPRRRARRLHGEVGTAADCRGAGAHEEAGRHSNCDLPVPRVFCDVPDWGAQLCMTNLADFVTVEVRTREGNAIADWSRFQPRDLKCCADVITGLGCNAFLRGGT